eukprot:177198_1
MSLGSLNVAWIFEYLASCHDNLYLIGVFILQFVAGTHHYVQYLYDKPTEPRTMVYVFDITEEHEYESQTIQCPQGEQCTVLCDATSACGNAHIYCPRATEQLM